MKRYKNVINLALISLITSSILFASEKIAIPLPAESLSIENSGLKQPIDAYQDGVGIYTLESLGANKVDNSEMNALVFKYGDAAKELNISVKEYVQTNGTNQEKELASTVGKFEPMVPGNGTVCNDNNMQTINDIYTNGVCAGILNYIELSNMILTQAGPYRTNRTNMSATFKELLVGTTKVQGLYTQSSQYTNAIVYAGDNNIFDLGIWTVRTGSSASNGSTDIFKIFKSSNGTDWLEIYYNPSRMTDGPDRTINFTGVQTKYLKIQSFSYNSSGYGHLNINPIVKLLKIK